VKTEKCSFPSREIGCSFEEERRRFHTLLRGEGGKRKRFSMFGTGRQKGEEEEGENGLWWLQIPRAHLEGDGVKFGITHPQMAGRRVKRRMDWPTFVPPPPSSFL
jgi:hypothetical protein